MNKAELRTLMREKIRALSREEIQMQSEQVCKRLQMLESYKQAEFILAYKAMKNECDPALFVEAARREGKKTVFPLCISDTELKLYIADEGMFNVGKYGILEPDPLAAKEIAPESIEFIAVPGVAFDRRLCRLGHGAGYYDRLLAHCKGAKVGIALDEQIVEYVPGDEHDLPMDRVLTASMDLMG